MSYYDREDTRDPYEMAADDESDRGRLDLQAPAEA